MPAGRLRAALLEMLASELLRRLLLRTGGFLWCDAASLRGCAACARGVAWLRCRCAVADGAALSGGAGLPTLYATVYARLPWCDCGVCPPDA